MKTFKVLSLLLFCVSIALGQTLYVPGGTIGNNTTNSNVGIGISNPARPLHINFNSGVQVRLQSLTAAWEVQSDAFFNGYYGVVNYTGGSADAAKSFVINGTNGFAGIGISNPTQKLHLFNASGSTYINLDKPSSSFEGGIQFSINNSPTFFFFSDNSDNDALKIEANLSGESDALPRMQFPKINKNIYMAQSGGNVGIGTASPDQLLTVKGIVHAQEVRVDLSVPGPDYVFQKNYELPALEEIKSYIDQNGHLPEVPSAAEMEKNGLQLGELNMVLLKKVEELTLYVIELKKEVETMKNKKENEK